MMWRIINILKITKSSIENDQHKLGYVSHFDMQLPNKQEKKIALLDCKGFISATNSCE